MDFTVGQSSGLNFAAAQRIAPDFIPNKNVVNVFPARMERYIPQRSVRDYACPACPTWPDRIPRIVGGRVAFRGLEKAENLVWYQQTQQTQESQPGLYPEVTFS